MENRRGFSTWEVWNSWVTGFAIQFSNYVVQALFDNDRRDVQQRVDAAATDYQEKKVGHHVPGGLSEV